MIRCWQARGVSATISMNFIFFSGGSYVGGMETVIQGLMQQLSKSGHRTLAVVSGWNNGDYPARLQASGLPFAELKLGRFYRSRPLWTLETIRNLPSAALTLRRLAEELRADVAIYPEPQLLLLGSVILPGVKSVLYEHNDVRHRRRSLTTKVTNARLHRVVCVSNFVASGVASNGVGSGKIAVVYNGVMLPSAPAPALSLDRALQLGIVGQLLPRKQHLTLVEAIGILKRRNPAVRLSLKIIGSAESAYAQAVKELVERLKLQDVVEWSGFFTNLDDIYRHLDIVVAPAIDEPFGMTVLEAGAYGLPVVAARSGGFSETIVDGTTGLLCEPVNPQSLADTLQKLIDDPSLRERLGRAGRSHIERTFTIERMASGFADAVSSIGPD